jgi:hypothetical protein
MSGLAYSSPEKNIPSLLGRRSTAIASRVFGVA